MELRIFTEPQEGADYATLLSVVQATERLGFDAFFRSDHYLTMSGSGLPGPTDAWTTLAGLARETSRIRLGTLMSPVTFRLPGPLAIAVAQVDQMSGPARRTTGDHHGVVGNPRGRDVLVRRRPLHAVRVTGAAQAGPEAAATGPDRRRREGPDTAAGG